MSDEIGAGTDPDAIPCDDSCGRQAQLTIVSFADRGVDYVCWPCLMARVVKIAADATEGETTANGEAATA
jgi:hypothetical protein